MQENAWSFGGGLAAGVGGFETGVLEVVEMVVVGVESWSGLFGVPGAPCCEKAQDMCTAAAVDADVVCRDVI